MFKIYTWKEYECDHHRECAEIGFDVGRRYGRREGIEIGEARVERETKADGYAVRELAHRERRLERREREIYREGESRRIESFGGDGLLPATSAGRRPHAQGGAPHGVRGFGGPPSPDAAWHRSYARSQASNHQRGFEH
ncbi:hypothetical protein LTR16_010394, partial [Cryomyces antarcticus]